MSKVLFTVALHHDGRPQFIVSCRNMTAFQISDDGVKIGNSNRKGFKNRFEYGVSGNKGVTKLSLIMNTTMWLPHIQWASPRPDNPIIGRHHSPSSSSSSSSSSSRTKHNSPDHRLTSHSHNHSDRRSSRSSHDSSSRHKHRRRRHGEKYADQAGFNDDGDFAGYTGDD